MNLWTMTGAELAAACAAPTPPPAYPRASDALASVLSGITRLSPADQAKLAAAFKAAQPRQIGQRRTFAGWDDFMPAYTAAREAVAGRVGERWYLDPTVALKARVPGAWVSCRVVGRTSASPRDVTMPRAEFWPGGALPVGPEYAEFGPIDPEGDVHTISERRAAGRKAAMRRAFPRLASALAFELEHTPDGEMDTSRLAAD